MNRSVPPQNNKHSSEQMTPTKNRQSNIGNTSVNRPTKRPPDAPSKTVNPAEGTSVKDRTKRKLFPTVSKDTKQPAVKNGQNVKPKRPKNDFIKPTDVVRIKGSYDKPFLVLVIIITLFGLVMDFSASYAYAFSKYGDSFFFVKKQALFALLGIGAMIFMMNFDYKWMRKLTVPYFIVMILLLLLVLIYGVASGVAQRWITIGGQNFQPSELMKPGLVLMLSLYVARNQDRITNYRNKRQSTFYGLIVPLLIVGIVCVLVLLEKHVSGTLIMFAIGAVVIFAAGAQLRWFILAGIAAVSAVAACVAFLPYARQRVMMLLYPENFDPRGPIWQTLQGLYAVGSGGLFGVGLGNSRQKHLYVSQPQNDFVFSIIAEELGFAGSVLVVVLFMLLIWRGFTIALKAPDTFSSLLVIGLISKVAIQALLNIAVVTNVIPNTGISLPFFSYGGTALFVQLAEMGAVLSVSRYSYQHKDSI